MAYPILVPDDIRLLFPNISDEEAQRLCDLIDVAIEAVTCTDIPDPTPPEVKYGALLWASQIYGAPGGGGAIMVSERIGDYSYTTTGGTVLDDTLATVPTNVAPYLMEYLCPGFKSGDGYELTIWPRHGTEPWVGYGYGWLPPSERVD